MTEIFLYKKILPVVFSECDYVKIACPRNYYTLKFISPSMEKLLIVFIKYFLIVIM
jgi:hypothetical protein